MQEEWVKISDFPRYAVSNLGAVMNLATTRIVTKSSTRDGTLKVGLMHHGGVATRSVKVLVAEAFVEGRNERFNTPIQLDGNQSNLRADNIAWRPRWFAVRYARQFSNPDWVRVDGRGPLVPLGNIGPVMEEETGYAFPTIYEAATKFGLLMQDIYDSDKYGNRCFPLGSHFVRYTVRNRIR